MLNGKYRRMHFGNIKRQYALTDGQARVFQEIEFQARGMPKPNLYVEQVREYLDSNDFDGSLSADDRKHLVRAFGDYLANAPVQVGSLLGDGFRKIGKSKA